MRFRKSVKICKGVRINFSKSGISSTVGMKGLSLNIGSKGTYLNTGIPGTGLYDRHKISGTNTPHSSSTKTPYTTISQVINIKADDSGNLSFFYETGEKITDPSLIRKIKSTPQFKAEQNRIMSNRFEEITSETTAFVEIYKLSPCVNSNSFYEKQMQSLQPKKYQKKPYFSPKPERATFVESLEKEAYEKIKSWNIFTLSAKRKNYIEENIDIRYAAAYQQWELRKTAHDQNEDNLEKRYNARYQEEYSMQKEILENLYSGNKIHIENAINDWLCTVSLPVDFNIQFEYSNNMIFLDLDLPEIEDIPTKKASVLANGTVKCKDKTQKELKSDYITCVFGLAVFFSANLFNISPAIENIIVSGYTQRRNNATGEIQDDYIYSINFTRDKFKKLNFKHENPYFQCLEFENRCNITANLLSKAIVPFDRKDFIK